MPKNRYDRKRGHKKAVGKPLNTISFSWAKLDPVQGQRIADWEQKQLLSKLCERLQQIGQFNYTEALSKQFIKQYTKVGFPENSKFLEPKHVSPTYWAVIHIKPNSKEVAVGYLEDNVFQIVFLDENHEFWPTDIQNRGKVKR